MSFLYSLIPLVLAIPVVLKYFRQVLNLLLQISEMLAKVVNSLNDNSLTEEEVKEIKKELDDVISAIKAFNGGSGD